MLYPGSGVRKSVLAQPVWTRAHSDLTRVAVTLELVHQDYVDTTSSAGHAVMGHDRFSRICAEVKGFSGASPYPTTPPLVLSRTTYSAEPHD